MVEAANDHSVPNYSSSNHAQDDPPHDLEFWQTLINTLPYEEHNVEGQLPATSSTASALSEALTAVSAALGLSPASASQSSAAESPVQGANYHLRNGDMEAMDDEITSNDHVEDEMMGSSKKRLSSDYSLSLHSDGDYVSSSSKPSPIPSRDSNGKRIESEVNSQVPKQGMVFSSEDEAYKFYKIYSEKIGFTVRKGKVERLSDKTIKKRHFLCSREGFRSKKQCNKQTKFNRKETRTGCQAKMHVTSEIGKWVISHVTLHHNHHLGGSGDRTDSYTNMSESTHSISHTNHESGMAKEDGAADSRSVRFHNVDCCQQPKDSQSLINYLRQLHLRDSSFFYLLDADSDGVKNLFWRDGGSKMDYDYFGDVLILETKTFKAGKYDMIGVPFLGINHHGQCILFGCALLLDESMDSLIWLFRTFMEAMDRHQPKTIFTDQVQAMVDAVRATMPETQHYFGLWHIRRNAAKHLSTYFLKPGFENFLDNIFDCQTEEEFESMWASLLQQFNLEDNLWLKTLYITRQQWSHIFFKKKFSAGIQSIQGAKRIVNLVQNMTSTGTMSLLQFFQQYEKSAEQMRREELSEDCQCIDSVPMMIFRSNIEKQAADIYTPTIFKIFQEELRRCLSVTIEAEPTGKMISTFKLVEEGDQRECIVAFNAQDSTTTCSCGRFESIGILCVHALKVLNWHNILHIPHQCILKRWRKDAKDRPVMGNLVEEVAENLDRPLSLCASELKHKAFNIIAKSAGKEECLKLVETYLEKAANEVRDVLKTG